tara:strand:- start:236 stop:478 length:243 start_codon:yes stop_codon:yes gene_type:complete
MNEILDINPESIEQLISIMDEDTYKTIQTAVEVGKWKDGTRLRREQVEHCLQILILYEARHFSKDSQTIAKVPSCTSKSK